MNFETLLKKYMTHVVNCESVSFASEFDLDEEIIITPSYFTDKEKEYLIKLDKELTQ